MVIAAEAQIGHETLRTIGGHSIYYAEHAAADGRVEVAQFEITWVSDVFDTGSAAVRNGPRVAIGRASPSRLGGLVEGADEMARHILRFQLRDSVTQAEIEIAKATSTLDLPVGGVIAKLIANEEDTVHVQGLLAIIDDSTS